MQNNSALLWLAIIAVVSILIPANGTPTTALDQCFLNTSLAICNSDIECKSRFYQDVYAQPYARQLFDLLLRQHLSTRLSLDSAEQQLLIDPLFVISQTVPYNPSLPITGDSAVDSSLQSCFDALQAENATAASLLLTLGSNQSAAVGVRWWLAVLRLADFCTENERFVLEENGCQCQPGKQCQEDPPGYFQFQIASICFAVALSVFVVLWHYYLFMREIRSLGNKISTTVKELRDAAALNLAQLSAAKQTATAAAPPPPPPQPGNAALQSTDTVAPAAARTQPATTALPNDNNNILTLSDSSGMYTIT